ncbi:MmpS family transport accessory protein [Micromonospora sp. RTP1Z1]|uniref:MmpS family transport accessory protein n=1 Tax=Micromonospora sp. RTP1Z1 TaxID=2994043 RepID=UPI0029C84DC1|nr:MmpS family transport accessory protein [Micromonospora sp. RTP1Z1]
MSEATPSPDPQPPGGWTPTDPTSAPTPTPWAPPDPLAAPQPWTAPAPWSPAPTAGFPPSAGQPSLASAPPGWPPPGDPPPYAHPGAPPPPTGGGRIAAVVIAVVTVLALGVCGCLGVAGFLGAVRSEPTATGEPFDEPYPGEPGNDVTGDTGGATQGTSQNPAATPSGGPGRLKVVYEVTGANPVDLQFYDANGDFFQLDGMRSPWRLAFTANDRQRVQLIASPGDPAGTGKVTCRITINGKVVSQVTGRWGTACFGW